MHWVKWRIQDLLKCAFEEEFESDGSNCSDDLDNFENLLQNNKESFFMKRW